VLVFSVLVSQIARRKGSGPTGHISLGSWVVRGVVRRKSVGDRSITRCG
jgi:hypothetical protein